MYKGEVSSVLSADIEEKLDFTSARTPTSSSHDHFSLELSYELSFSRMTILLFLDAISMHLDGENVNGSLPKDRVGGRNNCKRITFFGISNDGPILFYTREISARINRLIKRF